VSRDGVVAGGGGGGGGAVAAESRRKATPRLFTRVRKTGRSRALGPATTRLVCPIIPKRQGANFFLVLTTS